MSILEREVTLTRTFCPKDQARFLIVFNLPMALNILKVLDLALIPYVEFIVATYALIPDVEFIATTYALFLQFV